jgi:hypothetical protein
MDTPGAGTVCKAQYADTSPMEHSKIENCQLFQTSSIDANVELARLNSFDHMLQMVSVLGLYRQKKPCNLLVLRFSHPYELLRFVGHLSQVTQFATEWMVVSGPKEEAHARAVRFQEASRANTEPA